MPASKKVKNVKVYPVTLIFLSKTHLTSVYLLTRIVLREDLVRSVAHFSLLTLCCQEISMSEIRSILNTHYPVCYNNYSPGLSGVGLKIILNSANDIKFKETRLVGERSFGYVIVA